MDAIGGFFQQPFVGVMFAMMCFFGLLLLVVVAFILRARNQRASAVAPAAVATGGGDAELPALDMLLDTSSLLAETSPRQSRTGTFTLNLEDGDAVDAVEVMTVMRDVVNGNLIVQIGDKAYQSIAEHSDANTRDRFVTIMRELSQVASKSAQMPAASNPPAAEPKAAPPPPAKPKLSTTLPPPPPLEEGALPGDLPKFRLEDQPPPAPPPGLIRGVLGGKKAPSQPIPEINIAGAIEAYLQHKLRNTPEYAGRSIHVHPSPDGGVSIEVDGRYYNAVSDVEDAEVREFIATAIQEWQERH
jgi:DNA polymerase-3 subunit gamma/tau